MRLLRCSIRFRPCGAAYPLLTAPNIDDFDGTVVQVTEYGCRPAAPSVVEAKTQYRYVVVISRRGKSRRRILWRHDDVEWFCNGSDYNDVSLKLSAQVQYNYNTRKKFLYCSCIVVILHLCVPL